MPKLKETNIQKYEKVAAALKTAIDTIREYCNLKRERFDFNTPIPYGIGVDPSLLSAETLFKARKEGVEVNFLEVHTVGDIFLKMEWALRQFMA